MLYFSFIYTDKTYAHVELFTVIILIFMYKKTINTPLKSIDSFKIYYLQLY